MTTVLVIFGLVLFESWIYPNQSLMPAGLFHPVFGSGAGTGAGGVESGSLSAFLRSSCRWLWWPTISRPSTPSLRAASLWWLAFLTWLTTAVVIGVEKRQFGQPRPVRGQSCRPISVSSYFVAGVPAKSSRTDALSVASSMDRAL